MGSIKQKIDLQVPMLAVPEAMRYRKNTHLRHQHATNTGGLRLIALRWSTKGLNEGGFQAAFRQFLPKAAKWRAQCV